MKIRKRKEVWRVDPDNLEGFDNFKDYAALRFRLNMDVNTHFNFFIYQTDSGERVEFSIQSKINYNRFMRNAIQNQNSVPIQEMNAEETTEFYINMLECGGFYKTREFFY